MFGIHEQIHTTATTTTFLSKKCLRHSQCVLDGGCVYLILLKCIEERITKCNLSISKTTIDTLNLIDRHFLSYSHFPDFDGDKNSIINKKMGHLTRRTRSAMYLKGVDMGELQTMKLVETNTFDTDS